MAFDPPSTPILGNLLHICLRDRTPPIRQLNAARDAAIQAMRHDATYFNYQYISRGVDQYIDIAQDYLERHKRFLRILRGQQANDTGLAIRRFDQLEADMNGRVFQETNPLLQTLLDEADHDAPHPGLAELMPMAHNERNYIIGLNYERETLRQRIYKLQLSFATITTISQLHPVVIVDQMQVPIANYVTTFVNESQHLLDRVRYQNVVTNAFLDAFDIINNSDLPLPEPEAPEEVEPEEEPPEPPAPLEPLNAEDEPEWPFGELPMQFGEH